MKFNNLVSMFETQCKVRGAAKAYIFYDRYLQQKRVLTAAKLLKNARRTAGNIRVIASYESIELEGKVVFLNLNSVSDFIIAFWAALLAGGIPAPISRKMADKIPKLVTALSANSAAMVITDQQSMKVDCNVPVVKFSDLEMHLGVNTLRNNGHLRDKNLALVQYTSGSTSAPKPIYLTHQNIIHNLELIKNKFCITKSDIGASWLPHYHDMGLIGHILVPLYCGIENHFINPICFSANPINWLKLISTTKATISGAPNFGYQYCSEYLTRRKIDIEGIDLSCWRVAFTGAECISNSTVNDFSAMLSVVGFPPEAWYPCYGLAESTLMVSSRQGIKRCSLPGDCNSSYISVGSVKQFDVSVKRPSGIQCEDLEPGEIHIFSPSMTGYSRNGESLNTGDIGFLSRGELFIVGRQSNVIKYHGQKVFLEELESRLMECVKNSGVHRCLVVPYNGNDKLFLILESVKKTRPNINQEIQNDVTKIFSEFFGDTQLSILNLPRGGIKTTSSGKPDRVGNIKMVKDLFYSKRSRII